MVKKEDVEHDEGAAQENLGAVDSPKRGNRKRKASPTKEEDTVKDEKIGIKKEPKSMKKDEDEAVGAEIATMHSHQDSVNDAPAFLAFLKPDAQKTIHKAFDEIYPLRKPFWSVKEKEGHSCVRVGDGFDKTPLNTLLQAL